MYEGWGLLWPLLLRKILGASNFQIFKMINISFLKMVMLANLVSCPIAYILTNKWLETFAYRMELPLHPFIVSALITSVLTVGTVSFQAMKAVKAKPADALKYE